MVSDGNENVKFSENNDKNIFDEPHMQKYILRIKIFTRLLIMNSIFCFIFLMLYIMKLLKNIDFFICYTFFSMIIFHTTGMVHGIMRHFDFTRGKNGEAIYLKEYYPHIWSKINPYGHLFFGFEYLKYLYGKYIPKNTDPVIDKIRKFDRKLYLYALPFILMLIYIIIGLLLYN